MIFTTEERRLPSLYHSGSVAETAAVVGDAMNDITGPEERAAAVALMRKLEEMNEAGVNLVYLDAGDFYG